jgi:hypothetical protein
MLWYKSWLDTRWRFLTGLLILLALGCFTVMSYSMVQQLASSVTPAQLTDNDSLQQEIQESLEAMRTFPGYAWSQWFAGNFSSLLVIFAALLGSGSPLVKSGSGALFSLALPASRGRWIGTRAAMGLAELFAIALVPSVAITVFAPLVAEQFALMDAVVYGACAFVVASLFFGLAMFLSTVFNDVWRPLLLTCLVFIGLVALGTWLPEQRGLYPALTGRSFFYSRTLAWPELSLSAAGAAALLYAAAANVARRDF